MPDDGRRHDVADNGSPSPAVDVAGILDALPGRVFVLGPDLRILFVNRHSLGLLGLREDQALARTLTELIGPEIVALVAGHLDAALSGQTQAWSGRSELPTGETLASDYYVVPLPDESGGVGGLLYVGVDDVSRVHHADKTSAQHHFLSAHCDRLLTAADLSQRVATRLHDAAIALDALVEARDGSAAADADYVEVIQAVAGGIEALRTRVVELLRDAPDREDPQLPQSSSTYRPQRPTTSTSPPSLTALPVAGAMTPEHPRYRIFARALDAVPFTVHAWDLHGRCTYANQASAAAHRRTPAEMVGLSRVELFGEETDRAGRAFERDALAGVPQRYLRAQAGPGGTQWLVVDCVGQFVDGAPVGIVATSRPVRVARSESTEGLDPARQSLLATRRTFAEERLDPLLQRLFALTLTMTARRPDPRRGSRIATELEFIAEDLAAVIRDHTRIPEKPADLVDLPWPQLVPHESATPSDHPAALPQRELSCTVADCAAQGPCPYASHGRAATG